jgi:hypothetical protein
MPVQRIEMSEGRIILNRKDINNYKSKINKYEEYSNRQKEYFKLAKKKYPDTTYKVVKQKLVISGLHIEISEYEKPVWRGGKRRKESIEQGVEKRRKTASVKKEMDKEIQDLVSKYDISVTSNPEGIKKLEAIKRKYKDSLKSRSDNHNRKILKLKHKIQANFDIWTHFITLSFGENVVDMSLAKSRLNKWTKKMRDIFGESFKYVYVTEFQERGSIHFHTVCSLNPGTTVSRSKFNEIRESWPWGDNTNGIDIKGLNYKYRYIPKHIRESAKEELRETHAKEKIRQIWSIGNYLTSYLKKDANSVLLFGSKMYGNSTDLKEEIEITDAKKIAQIKRELGLDKLKENIYEFEIPKTDNKVLKKFYNVLIPKKED